MIELYLDQTDCAKLTSTVDRAIRFLSWHPRNVICLLLTEDGEIVETNSAKPKWSQRGCLILMKFGRKCVKYHHPIVSEAIVKTVTKLLRDSND